MISINRITALCLCCGGDLGLMGGGSGDRIQETVFVFSSISPFLDPSIMNVSSLYAASVGKPCSGRFSCYWCASPCDGELRHGLARVSSPFRLPRLGGPVSPASPFLCSGCWLYRRGSQSLRTISGKPVERVCLLHESWLITSSGCSVIRSDPEDVAALWDVLLNPPLRS